MLSKQGVIGYAQVILGVLLILGIVISYNSLLDNARDLQQGENGLSGWIWNMLIRKTSRSLQARI